MKKLNALNLGKSLNREEMKSISGGIVYDGGEVLTCTCGTDLPVQNVRGCGCLTFCNNHGC